jgi:16S rRNA (adenine1518-N6/adenine1519-N6)-dimethyltransferase
MMEKFRAKKRFGQNFLTDRHVLRRIAEAVGTGAGDRVLEIGPGKGALTELLAASGASVLAVEIDRDLVPFLRRKFATAENVEIVENDILETDLPALLLPRGERWKVAANLPYNISSQVLFAFLDNVPLFSELTLMLQKEVAERIASPPGSRDYGILSVLCRLHFDVSVLFTVRPGSFHPVPKVDSAILRLVSLPSPRFDVGDEALFRRIVKGAFGTRRKTLRNSLRGAGIVSDDASLDDLLARTGIDGGRRGETLSLEEYALLSRTLFATR